MKIIKIILSPRRNKRYRAILNNQTYIDFGYKSPEGKFAQTFIDGATREKRNNYLKRHLANRYEAHKIKYLIMSPALLSAMILWNTDNLKKNINILNRLLSKKYQN